MGSTVKMVILVVIGVGAQGAMVYTDYYLAEWSKLNEAEQTAERETKSYEHLISYSVFFGVTFLLLFSRGLLYMHLAVKASEGLHNQAFTRIMQCSIRFFDTQPVGRILNRFAKDMVRRTRFGRECACDRRLGGGGGYILSHIC
jgi:ABC-type multidrug transport system fused ATPase/permease subunit